MTCKAASGTKINPGLVAGLVCGGGVLLLLMLLVYLSFNRLGRIKRQLEWWRKHLAGMPKCGEMSIVVTDIEGYSGEGSGGVWGDGIIGLDWCMGLTESAAKASAVCLVLGRQRGGGVMEASGGGSIWRGCRSVGR
jgi:hypothetical protein